jgi:hypothetical protein
MIRKRRKFSKFKIDTTKKGINKRTSGRIILIPTEKEKNE